VNSFGLDVCEVCGSQSADHAGWFAVTGNGPSMEVLPWTDEVRDRSDCRHACCGDHVEKLVISSATRELSGATFLAAPRHGGWNPQALMPRAAEDVTAADSNESFANILSAVESILLSPDEEDEEEPRAFDA
jgi:hypothetical protein